MFRGKPILVALVMAILCQAGLSAEEAVRPYVTASCVTSLRKNAVVTIGGEVAVDYSYRSSETTVTGPASASPTPIQAHIGDMSVKNANLRIAADVHPHVSAFFKIDLSSNTEYRRDRDEILEEALLVMSSVGGTGLGFFAGKGRVPYGQDVTLGMLQSYHHMANQVDSSEGLIFLSDPVDEADPDPDRYPKTPPMRPGQVERVFLAGASYQWDDRWKVEVAAFQPDDFEFRDRLGRDDGKSPGRIGAAARVWWRPFEELTLQLSGMAMRSHAMARLADRLDIADYAGTDGAATAYAVSLGFDYRRGPWRVFGEYQRGIDWNFTDGYTTDTWQVGAAREFGDGWRAGAMLEGLHIDNASPREAVTQDFYKLAFNLRYTFTSGMFVIAEYGHEWGRRTRGGALADKRRGDFIGVRFGFAF